MFHTETCVNALSCTWWRDDLFQSLASMLRASGVKDAGWAALLIRQDATWFSHTRARLALGSPPRVISRGTSETRCNIVFFFFAAVRVLTPAFQVGWKGGRGGREIWSTMCQKRGQWLFEGDKRGEGGGRQERGRCVSVSAPGTARSALTPGLSGGAKSFPQALPTPCGGVATCPITLWSLPVFTFPLYQNSHASANWMTRAWKTEEVTES